MRAAWSERRTCGKVGGGRLFLCAAAQASLFLAKEHERRRDQGEVMMEALPRAALEVVQSEFVLEFTVVLLDAPARLGGGDEFG